MMLTQLSPMEVMRRFLAAFAGSDKKALMRLLSDDARLTISKNQIWFQSQHLPQVVDFLLAETGSWTRRRIDVQSWSEKQECLLVKFHVGVQRNGRKQEYAYTLTLHLKDAQISMIEVCGQNIATAKSVWQMPKRPHFRLAA